MNHTVDQSKKENKISNIYFPLWLVAVTAVICIVAGILIGNGIKKENSDKDSKAVNATAAVQDSTTTTLPAVDKTQWNLILVNKSNPLPDHYEIELTQLKNGLSADSRCYPDLQQMMDDCRGEGLNPIICSAYRTQEKQQALFDRQVEKWKNQGYSAEEAKIQAGTLVAIPGTSEHQTGLAFDIVDDAYQLLDEEQEKTAVQQWLLKNSWKYGFILRYPTDKSDITGISYEPWHYRYVGRENAKIIYDSGICLEEYLAD